jgi:hypothetical protein
MEDETGLSKGSQIKCRGDYIREFEFDSDLQVLIIKVLQMPISHAI